MLRSIGESPRDDKCGCTQYDDGSVHEAHDTRGSADLQTSLQISLTREGPRGVRAHLGIYTHTCGPCVEKYYISNLSEIGGHPICHIIFQVKARRNCKDDADIASKNCDPFIG